MLLRKRLIIFALLLIVIIPMVIFILSSLSKSKKNDNTKAALFEATIEGEHTTINAEPEKIKKLKMFDAHMIGIDKALIRVKYKNNSNYKLTGVQIWFKYDYVHSIESKSGFATVPESNGRRDKNKKSNEYFVVRVPDLPAKSSSQTEVWFFRGAPSVGKISAELYTTSGLTTKTNSVQVITK